MKYIAVLNGKKYEVEVEKVEEYRPISRAQAANPAAYAAPAAPAPISAPVKPAAPAPSGATNVTSPMPGTILDMKVSVGDKVKAGQILLILEAMKMENEIVAPIDATVASLSVKKGDTVDTDATLVVLK